MQIPDVSHPDAFENGFPHEVFRELRREAPVYWHEGDYEGGRGYWIISRYQTIKTISRQPMLFSSASGTSIEDRGSDFVSMMFRPKSSISAGRTVTALIRHAPMPTNANTPAPTNPG